ncbi:pali-domain-containing protein [Xylaria nigripes]|nr:pali-domain-containing protein [Xylaria nigripes]
MARTGFIHHFGTFFLFAAFVILLVTSISAPVVSDIALLRVELGTDTQSSVFRHDQEHHTITFGAFGYCTRDIGVSGTACSHAHVGYDPVEAIQGIIGDVPFSDYAHDTSRALTRVMVLHPVATVLAFISFLLAAGAGFLGSFLAAMGAFITFIVVLVVLITDFVSLAIVKSAINDSGNDVDASWGSAIWGTLAAAVIILLASVILLFTCCSARIHRRRNHHREIKLPPTSTTSRRRWFSRT